MSDLDLMTNEEVAKDLVKLNIKLSKTESLHAVEDALMLQAIKRLNKKIQVETKTLTELQIHDKIVGLENKNDEMLIEMRTCNRADHELYEISIRKNIYLKQGLLIVLGNQME